MNRINKFSCTAYPLKPNETVLKKFNILHAQIAPFKNTTMSNKQYKAVVRCRVCDGPWRAHDTMFFLLREYPISDRNLVESGDNYYLVCGEACRELFLLNPLAYES